MPVLEEILNHAVDAAFGRVVQVKQSLSIDFLILLPNTVERLWKSGQDAPY